MDNDSAIRALASFDAVCAAYEKARLESLVAYDDRARALALDASKILEALMAALRTNNGSELASGASWARKVLGELERGARAPSNRTTLVRKLLGALSRPRGEGAHHDAIANDAAFFIAASTLIAVPSPQLLAKRIARVLHELDDGADDELRAKAILRAAGLDEKDAGNWVANVTARKGRRRSASLPEE